MDVEIQNVMDEIMETMHQISWWMMELQKKELDGVKINKEQILENIALKKLFEKNQDNYRELHQLIAKRIIEQKERYVESSSTKTQEELFKKMQKQLLTYLDASYMKLRLIPFSADGKKMFKSIYSGTPNEEIMVSEYTLQVMNLDYLGKRINSLRSEKLSFMDKGEILQYCGRKRFFDYAFDELEQYIQQCESRKLVMQPEIYTFEREKLLGQKYTQYYSYFNNKYNTFIQEDDIGKFKMAKLLINNGDINVALNMNKFEIESNIQEHEKQLKDSFDDYMKGLIELISKVKLVESPKRARKREMER